MKLILLSCLVVAVISTRAGATGVPECETILSVEYIEIEPGIFQQVASTCLGHPAPLLPYLDAPSNHPRIAPAVRAPASVTHFGSSRIDALGATNIDEALPSPPFRPSE